ncbi:MAG TPA: acyl-CoA thioesterase/bile acid-CoA:amino acid N-acyltransferase family protein [Longimicrobiales bacterium]
MRGSLLPHLAPFRVYRLLAACLLAPGAAAAQSTARIVATPDTVLFDQPIHVRVTGLAPGDTATLRAGATDAVGRAWKSTATFTADARGEIDVARQAPLRGDYAGAEPMGLFWSMASPQPPGIFVRDYFELPTWARRSFRGADTTAAGMEAVPTRLDLDVRGRTIASTTVLRRFVPPGTRITRVREHGLYGVLYEPPGEGPHPALVALTGSSGGILPFWSLLAARGYTTLALGWLDLPGTAQQMLEVPVESFDSALAWLRRRTSVDTARMGVIGWSLGGEASLLVASLHPELKAAVVMAGSPVVWEGVLHDTLTNAVLAQPTGKSTWTRQGAPLPFATRRWAVLRPGLVASPGSAPAVLTPADNHDMYVATMSDSAEIARGTMALERSSAAFLLVSARDDETWPSAALSRIAIERLRRAGYARPYEQVVYDVGGHGVANPPYMIGGLRMARPGMAAAIVHRRADAWARELRFLDEHLAHAGSKAAPK